METRAPWVNIAVAGVCAVVLMGTAVAFGYTQRNSASTGTVTAVTTKTDTTSTEDDGWRAALDAIASTTVAADGSYKAPSSLPPTEAVARELFADYIQKKQDGTLTKEEQVSTINKLIAQNVATVTPSVTYTLGNVKTDSSVSVSVYAGALAASLQKSTAVKEYELTTFARTIGQNNTSGTPTLASAAVVYATIEKELLAMRVPPKVAAEHLSLLQAVSNLAHATKLMSTWSGDPIVALSYVDAFAKAEQSTQTSVATLFAVLNKNWNS
jgi:hypothetical protein